MKRPSISFNKEAILEFLLNHGDKIGVAIIAALACGLVWGGIDAVRTRPAGKEIQPPAIAERATRAVEHIQQVKQPPAEEMKKTSLAKSIAPWRAPEIATPPTVALLNKPLFEERSKRSRPEVFPIEELRAVAGIAFMPERQAAAAAERNAADVEPADNPDQPGLPKRPKPRPNRGRGAEGQGQMPGGVPMPNEFGPGFAPPPGMEMMPGMPMQNVTRGRLVPYCVVTGLVPVQKQADEYMQRYAAAGFRDQRRDMPLWSDYLVERSVVAPGGRENWERIDVKSFLKTAQRDWAGIQSEQLPPGFVLPPEQNPGATIGYSTPLPLLAGEPWGSEALHPWFLEQIKKTIAEQAETARQAAEAGTPVLGQNPAAGPEFQSPLQGSPLGNPEFGPGPGMMPMGPMGPGGPMGPMGPGMMVDAAGQQLQGLEYRLFRFVDTTVEPGKSYRYRVRLSIWNPNYEVEARYLTDPALAKEPRLASQPSNVTQPVAVPGTTSMLVRALRKAELKRFKQGMWEVLVVDKAAETGNYALRSLVTEVGGLANVDKRLNKPGDPRTRGEDAFTDRVLVDVFGKQEDRSESRSNKPTPPPEPFEMLFLRTDGTFEIASAADSQLQVDRHIGTLPVADEAKPGGRDRSGAGGESPFGGGRP